MTRSEPLEITPALCLPAGELRYRFSRAGGPGGQHQNKVETRASVVFALDASTVLSAEQRERIREKLATRINKLGELVVHADEHREQGRNLAAARERLAELLRRALARPRARRATKPTRSSRERRLKAKKHDAHARQRRAAHDE